VKCRDFAEFHRHPFWAWTIDVFEVCIFKATTTQHQYPKIQHHQLSLGLPIPDDDLARAMTQLPLRTSSLLDDRLRPQSTSDIKTGGVAKATDISRPPSTAPRVTETSKANAESLSDKATAAFIRRTLCAHHALSGTGEKGRSTPRPVDELLPPLTSSNEVDLQLYAILAVILKEFVYVWYAKITPDHVFIDEVIQVIAHCTRALEQRLRKVDLESILLDEVPQLIEAHLAGASSPCSNCSCPIPISTCIRVPCQTFS
jgi:hypothetical protein